MPKSAVSPKRISANFVALLTIVALLLTWHDASAQTTEPSTRTGALEQVQAEKVKLLAPQEPEKFERLTARAEAMLTRGGDHWYPYFENSYSGGGFRSAPVIPGSSARTRHWTCVAASRRPVTSWLNRSSSIRGFSTAAERLALHGGWRKPPRCPLWARRHTGRQPREAIVFKQPYVSGLLNLKPTRKLLVVSGGIEYTQWKLQRGEGALPVDRRYFRRRGTGRHWREGQLPAYSGRVRLRLADVGRSIRAAAGTTASRCTTMAT